MPVTSLKHRHETPWPMDQATTHFDWIGWLTSVPGIPAGWGQTPASPAPVSVVPAPAAPRPRTMARVSAVLSKAA